MSLEANKALLRRMFEEVIPAGDPRAMRKIVAADFLDHDPMPGQPAGVQGAEYVVSTMNAAYPDLRFTVDDLLAEGDRVAMRWTLRGTHRGPFLGRPPTGRPVQLCATTIWRIKDGKVTERWAGWKPGYAPF